MEERSASTGSGGRGLDKHPPIPPCESLSGGGRSGAAAGEAARRVEPRGREQVIAAGDPRPPELRRPSPRSWAQRQPPIPGLIGASYRLRTRFSGIPLPARASEAPGSRSCAPRSKVVDVFGSPGPAPSPPAVRAL
ncbi:hypothetical protein NN561_013239 [Cricetulus griseus]